MSPVKSTGYMEGMKKKTLRRPLSRNQIKAITKSIYLNYVD